MSLEDHLVGGDFESLKGKFKDVESLAKAYQNLERLQGKSIALPETEAEREKFYKQVGVPDSVDGYPEGGNRELAKDLRLTPDQYERLRGRERADAKHWEEFVEGTPNFEEKASSAKIAAERLGVEIPKEKGAFIALSELGRTMSNDTAPDGGGSSEVGGAKRAANRLQEILASDAWNNRRANPAERLAIKEEADKLYKELAESGYQSPFDPRI
jgi:hypothetical protein